MSLPLLLPIPIIELKDFVQGLNVKDIAQYTGISSEKLGEHCLKCVISDSDMLNLNS